jgi:phosphate-selective porin
MNTRLLTSFALSPPRWSDRACRAARPRPATLVWLLGLLLPLAAGRAQTVEERLAHLEAALQELRAENASLRQQLEARPAAIETQAARLVVPVPAGKETRLVLGGFLQGQAEFGGAADPRFSGVRDRFFFRRARIYLAGSFAEHFEFKSELDLQGNTLSAGTGQLARANEIYIGWNRFPAATVRFGQLKPAFGAEQLMSDTVMPTIERFLASDRLSDSRQLGAGLYGSVAGGRFGYLAVVGNGNGSNVSANDNSKFLTSARAFGTIVDSPERGRLVLGMNGLHSEDDGVTRAGLGLDSVPGGAVDNLLFGTREGWGGDASWKHGRLSLSTEYLQMRYRPRNAVPAPAFTARGWQATAGWFVVPEVLQAVVRREAFDPNNHATGDDGRTWTFGLNYLLKGDDIKFQLNYLHGAHPEPGGNTGRWLSRVQIIY